MCGILGTSNIEISEKQLNKSFSYIKHRGPDFQDLKKFSNFIFGHSRLSIIDIDNRSNQPFQYTANDRIINIVFNGEIYNFLNLKEILIGKGYLFNTNSDTEVICASFIEWGYQCFDKFEGMWALAINENEIIIISRDRIGKKPLYYSNLNNQLNFSSSLLAVQNLTQNKKINSEAIELYFALGFVPDEFSIFEGIKKLRPGQILVYTVENKQAKLIETLQTIYQEDPKSLKSIKEEIENSISKRLISDVPIATLMSGGVDSTIVTALTKNKISNLKAFFVNFNQKSFSEKKWFDYLANRNKIKYKELLLSNEDLIDKFKDYYQVYEEPFSDYSGLPTMAIFEKVSQNYKVVLTGDGGDELFYGYPHYFNKWVLYCLNRINEFLPISIFLPNRIKNIITCKISNFESNYLKFHNKLTPFSEKFIDTKFNDCRRKSNSFLRSILLYDRVFYNLPEKYLVKVDRASMYYGVEVRSPFLDESLFVKVKNISLLKLFTPFHLKIYAKILYFNLFGLKYLFAKKRGFTPPIQILRDSFFDEKKFEEVKKIILLYSFDLTNSILSLNFSDLKKDSILFDRFFFFYSWYIKIIKEENE